ncbi:MAG: aspartate dehydrogenase [Burkholderia sp.]|nr:aspartate dehydrogenase [Burkholderia sp.]
MNIGIVGFGAIGQTLYKLIAEHASDIRVDAVVERQERHDAVRGQLLPGTRLVASVQEMLAAKPALVIECAGHAALKAAGAEVLAAGCDLLVASVGALADTSIESALRSAAQAGSAKIRIPSGALGGLDVLGAARLAGLAAVTYTSNKAPRAWKGTPAEEMIDLDKLTEAQAFFTGDAREAALRFPQNANVAAAVALAGIGFEKTVVNLIANPAATGNRHRIQAHGAFGEIDVSILGKTLPDNPKTSMLAPYSLIRSLANLTGTIVVG